MESEESSESSSSDDDNSENDDLQIKKRKLFHQVALCYFLHFMAAYQLFVYIEIFNEIQF